MKRFLLTVSGAAVWMAASADLLRAAETFHCEVLAVKGEARLQTAAGESTNLREGDLLPEGSALEIVPGGYVDLAYDRDWNNVVRVEGGSSVRVASVLPAKLELSEGGVYARLKSLPSRSSFDVQTPTAIAAVRGTEFRTTFRDGKSDVFNFSESRVYVHGLDSEGSPGPPTVVEYDQKASVVSPGAAPEAPAAMSGDEREAGQALKRGLEVKIDEAISGGRIGKIQTVVELEKAVSAPASRASHDPESRVSDTRRRQFAR